jgi:predicted patatin/cPLA2 family phospholipase
MKVVIEHEGDVGVFREALEHAYAQKGGHVSKARPALVILAGILRGVYGGGGVRALENAGLRDGFHSGVGVSAGVPTLAYFLAGQAEMGTTIYFEECISGKFFNFSSRYIENIWYLQDVWSGTTGSKKLDIAALATSPTYAYASALPLGSTHAHLLDIRRLVDPVEGLVAACAISGLYEGTPQINGVPYLDSMSCEPCPSIQLIDEVDPTSFLVFTNRPKNDEDNTWGIWLYDRYVRYILGDTSHIFAPEKQQRRLAGLEAIRTSGKPYCIIYTDDAVHPFTRNREILMAAADRYEAYVAALIVQAHAALEAEGKIG